MFSINPRLRTVPLWLAVGLVLLTVLVVQLLNHRQSVEDYRHMGERYAQSDAVQKLPEERRPSQCDWAGRMLVGKSHADARVAAFFEGCSGLDADD